MIKDMSSQSSNKKDMITVTLELMEYIPQTIKAKKKKVRIRKQFRKQFRIRQPDRH